MVLLCIGVGAAGWAQTPPSPLRLSANGEVVRAGAIYLFSDVAVGARSSPVTFVLANLGSADLSLGRPSVTIEGRNAVAFVVVDQLPRVLPAGGSASFRMIFAPRSVGPSLARVSIDGAGRSRLYEFLAAGNGAPGP